jgi:hypothetical protein
MRRRQSPFLHPSTETGPGVTIGAFGLKIGWEIARAFLTEAASAVPLPDQAGGDDGNHEFGRPFHHFGVFSSSTALII